MIKTDSRLSRFKRFHVRVLHVSRGAGPTMNEHKHTHIVNHIWYWCRLVTEWQA